MVQKTSGETAKNNISSIVQRVITRAASCEHYIFLINYRA